MDRVRPFVDARITLLSRNAPGPGGYAARNLAIRSARSEWIAFLDADDAWKPHFIEEISGLISAAAAGTGCVFTGYEKVWSSGQVVADRHSTSYRQIRSLDFDDFLTTWLELGMSPIWTSACAIRRRVLLEAGLFPEGRCKRGGDKDTWLRAMAHTRAASSARIGATYYTVTENQVTRRETFNVRPCVVGTVEEMLRTAPDRRRALLKRLVNLEIFEYALMTGPHERLSPNIACSFHAAVNPVRYILLLMLARLPIRPRNLLKTLIHRTRSLMRKLSRESRTVPAPALTSRQF
jgi:glycosyltransferase involved in cell wall biosynthesis